MTPTTSRRLLLWRHGRTEWNADGRVQGQQDVGLDEVGRRQAEIAAPVLAQHRPAVIVSSDLRRARDTALVLARHLRVEAQLDSRLRERGFGAWEGLDSAQMAALYPEEFARWRAGGEPDVPGIETESAMKERVQAGIDDALARDEGTVCLVVHGGVAKRALSLLLGWPTDAPWGFVLDNCCWIELRRRDNNPWRLQAYNVGAQYVGAQVVEDNRANTGVDPVIGTSVDTVADIKTSADMAPIVP